MSAVDETTVVVNNTPGSVDGSVAPLPGEEIVFAVDHSKQYVAGRAGASSWWINYAQSLPANFDDITRDFGIKIYDRMINDPKLSAILNILRAMILEDGFSVLPFVFPKKEDPETSKLDPTGISPVQTQPQSPIQEDTRYTDDDRALAKEIADTLEENLKCLPMETIMWDMLRSMEEGYKVAEITYDLRDNSYGKPKYFISSLMTKPRGTTAFVQDVFGNNVGIMGIIPGVAQSIFSDTILIDPKNQPNLLPREKFLVLSFRMKDNDPRGTSVLRASYSFWNIKQQLIREYLKYLTQFASPSLFATTPEGATFQRKRDENNIPITPAVFIDPWLVLEKALENFRNGTALAAPFGTELKEIWSQGDGRAFLIAFLMLNDEMVSSVLGQTQASENTGSQSRASSNTQQDILDTIVRVLKKWVTTSFKTDVVIPWITYNWGPDACKFCPTISLGETERADLPAMMTAVSRLFAVKYLSPSQMAGLDRMLNLAPRTQEEQQMIFDLAIEMARQKNTKTADGLQPGDDPSAYPDTPAERGNPADHGPTGP